MEKGSKGVSVFARKDVGRIKITTPDVIEHWVVLCKKCDMFELRMPRM